MKTVLKEEERRKATTQEQCKLFLFSDWVTMYCINVSV